MKVVNVAPQPLPCPPPLRSPVLARPSQASASPSWHQQALPQAPDLPRPPGLQPFVQKDKGLWAELLGPADSAPSSQNRTKG